IKAGAGSDEFDEFVEIYNRSGGIVPTSSLKLHIVNAAGTVDTNVSLTWRNNGNLNIPIRGFLLITPASSAIAGTADATYATSTLLSIVPNGALYISNSVASSTAVLDKVCWGTHSTASDCEGPAASALINNGQSIERKALNDSTAATMTLAGSHADQGNGIDTQNNNFDFVVRAVPLLQNTASVAETPTLGSWGASNQAPNIMAAPIFTASASSTFNVVARISDDGGAPPAANTQLIFCTDDTNTCQPSSSTPIYGVSIGAGWYKFTPTTTPWNNFKNYFRYYLQAADSVIPAKTRVFTNDPSFDSVTYNTSGTGIQTAALQISKALSVNVSQGNLGTATISGTVNDSSNAGVGGATVWIDGKQFAATTGNDGTFSFTNVGPSGGMQVKVAKDGYVDQSISTFLPPTGLVSLGTMTLYSGNMGQGGDYNMPRVVSSFPMPGMMGFPTQSPSGGAPTMDITFSKAMDTTTIVDTDASNAGSNIYLTEAGSDTKMGGSAAMIPGSTTQARFTPTATLTAGRGYTLFITPGAKDTVGNPVSGNGPGGAYVLMFSTASGMFSAPGAVTGFGTGNSFPPYVVGSQPVPGKVNVSLNSKAFVTFSEAIQNTDANLANVKLYKVTGANTASESESLVAAANSLDASNKIVIVSSTANLIVSSDYRVKVLGGLSSAKGIPMGNPVGGYATNAMYRSDFQTGTGADSTAPTVAGTIPAASATAVSTIRPIVINFSETMNPATITENSVSLKIGSTAVAGNLTYDPNNRTATFVPSYALTATSTYTINVTTDVQDLAGRALAAALLRTFTTGSADTSSPSVVSAQASDFSMKIVYSQPMLSVTASDGNYAASVLNPARYLVRMVSSAGAVTESHALPLGATLSYDPSSRSVSISGFTPSYFTNVVTVGSTLLNIVVSSTVKDIGFNTLATGGNAATTTAQSSAKTGGFGGGMGMGPMMGADGNIMQGGMMGGPPPMVGTFLDSGIGFAPGVKVYPFNKMAGVSTIYGVEAPISYQVPNAGFIDITFPEGTDVSNAKKDTNSPPNSDLNGPGPGTVVFGTAEGTLPNGFATGGQSADGVIVNATTRVVRVILGAVATRRGTANLTSGDGDQHDYLRLDIAQITNSTISSGIDTSGNSATVETKKTDGTLLESLSSGSFFTTAAGDFTVRGVVTTTASGINGANVFLMSPMTGPMTSSSA
ncbi:MAG: Ig-like domain-containing protein, partial [Candidatus Margulisiibacteriota bacterium]